MLNDTGTTLVVGPDAEGKFFSVAPGEEYALPAPPRTVSDEEKEAAEAAAAAPKSKKKASSTAAADETTNTEGAQA